mmetsp:Transcript_1159/g.1927  ORF Transcript_1159/g.1927 Transcript_1159/m.1927 type:complete len:200 (-) Transcript_1159:679-1278(-)
MAQLTASKLCAHFSNASEIGAEGNQFPFLFRLELRRKDLTVRNVWIPEEYDSKFGWRFVSSTFGGLINTSDESDIVGTASVNTTKFPFIDVSCIGILQVLAPDGPLMGLNFLEGSRMPLRTRIPKRTSVLSNNELGANVQTRRHGLRRRFPVVENHNTGRGPGVVHLLYYCAFCIGRIVQGKSKARVKSLVHCDTFAIA